MENFNSFGATKNERAQDLTKNKMDGTTYFDQNYRE